MEKQMQTDEFLCPPEYTEEKPGRTYRNITHITYFSKTTGSERGANVLLPAGYREDKKYPVIYFMHGIFCHEGTMLYDENSMIPEILGNMADAGEAREVIAVFANIYVTSDPNMAPGFNPESIIPYDHCIDDLVNDLDPYITEHYSVLEGPENKAILGFSMGGREALYIGLVRSDLFGYICAVAPAPGLIPGKDWAMEHPGMLSVEELEVVKKDTPPGLIVLCRGSKDSVVGRFPVEYHELMEQKGIEHLWFEIPGYEHGEPITQCGLYNLMKRWK